MKITGLVPWTKTALRILVSSSILRSIGIHSSCPESKSARWKILPEMLLSRISGIFMFWLMMNNRARFYWKPNRNQRKWGCSLGDWFFAYLGQQCSIEELIFQVAQPRSNRAHPQRPIEIVQYNTAPGALLEQIWYLIFLRKVHWKKCGPENHFRPAGAEWCCVVGWYFL